jgi:hypothetical protein
MWMLGEGQIHSTGCHAKVCKNTDSSIRKIRKIRNNPNHALHRGAVSFGGDNPELVTFATKKTLVDQGLRGAVDDAFGKPKLAGKVSPGGQDRPYAEIFLLDPGMDGVSGVRKDAFQSIGRVIGASLRSKLFNRQSKRFFGRPDCL